MTGTQHGANGTAEAGADTKKKMEPGDGKRESGEIGSSESSFTIGIFHDGLLEPQPMDPERAERLRIATLVVCGLSVIFTFLEGSCSMTIAIMEDSAASFAFSFTALLDSLTSIVVIWRYYGNGKTINATDKERRALFLLGVLFIISFITTFGKSAWSLATEEKPRRASITWNVAVANTVVSATLASAKFYLATQLNSKSIFSDGLNSAVSTILAGAIIASSVVYDYHRSVWYLDASVGVICAVFLLYYGVKLIYAGRAPFLQLISRNDSSQYVEMDDKNEKTPS